MTEETGTNKQPNRLYQKGYISREDISARLEPLLELYSEGGFKNKHIKMYIRPLVERLKSQLGRRESPGEIVFTEAKSYLAEKGWAADYRVGRKGYFPKRDGSKYSTGNE